ncbi:unnamed protein product [Acanthosepion pharaonis]|uniref:Uncharacterized protein n=1 Tax=Acanthosepion pharaonis TaxID=158019 RepID=A0A812EC21_ACAPH|nr:unnamed protein product [Sepia pharaonis]
MLKISPSNFLFSSFFFFFLFLSLGAIFNIFVLPFPSILRYFFLSAFFSFLGLFHLRISFFNFFSFFRYVTLPFFLIFFFIHPLIFLTSITSAFVFNPALFFVVIHFFYIQFLLHFLIFFNHVHRKNFPHIINHSFPAFLPYVFSFIPFCTYFCLHCSEQYFFFDDSCRLLLNGTKIKENPIGIKKSLRPSKKKKKTRIKRGRKD